MSRIRVVVVAAGLAATVVMAGCMTGKRPSLAPAVAEVADPAVQGVLDKLQAANSTQFTATYSIQTKLAPTAIPTTTATVAQSDPATRSITIGTIRFLIQSGTSTTCNLASAEPCEDGVNDARTSDLLVTHEFYAVSPAARLRQDSATMAGAAVASTRDVAGNAATCVQVNFASGAKVYCALDNGLLAFQDTPDLQIELVSLDAGAASSLFTTSTGVG